MTAALGRQVQLANIIESSSGGTFDPNERTDKGIQVVARLRVLPLDRPLGALVRFEFMADRTAMITHEMAPQAATSMIGLLMPFLTICGVL